ncbi:MAG TPA: flagellar FlbD family protein [Phycisphaerae bacterium]|nr:flagellar FlbD family protein [Phycisphaerae bacterium]
MIPLTKLSNQPFVLNAELIKFIESTPDTMITLTTGDRMIVKESTDEVIRRVIDYGRLLRRLIEPS